MKRWKKSEPLQRRRWRWHTVRATRTMAVAKAARNAVRLCSYQLGSRVVHYRLQSQFTICHKHFARCRYCFALLMQLCLCAIARSTYHDRPQFRYFSFFSTFSCLTFDCEPHFECVCARAQIWNTIYYVKVGTEGNKKTVLFSLQWAASGACRRTMTEWVSNGWRLFTSHAFYNRIIMIIAKWECFSCFFACLLIVLRYCVACIFHIPSGRSYCFCCPDCGRAFEFVFFFTTQKSMVIGHCWVGESRTLSNITDDKHLQLTRDVHHYSAINIWVAYNS